MARLLSRFYHLFFARFSFHDKQTGKTRQTSYTDYYQEVMFVNARKKYSLCNKNLNQFVNVSLTNGVDYEGYIVDVNPEYFTLAVPYSEDRGKWGYDERSPLALITLPLFFLAGMAVGRRRPSYPYPPYYPQYPAPYPAPYPYKSPYPPPYSPYPYK